MATIDLSQLPAPDVVESLDYETLLAERKATLISLYPADQQDAVARTLTLESEPIVKLLQENAYRELILRQRINEAAKAVMVAYSMDGDLDQLGANNGVPRLIITPADDTTIPPTPAVMESNDDFRLRIASAFEGLSVAGPTGAYEYHAKSADGRVADASAISPSPSVVTVSGFKSVIDAQPWIISKVTHSLSGSGYTTALEFEVLLSDIEYQSETEGETETT